MDPSPTRPWIKHYPPYLPEKLDLDKYPSLLHFFDQKMKEFQPAPALENMGKMISYQELEDLSTALAAYFQNELGLRKGEVIAIQMPNILQYPIAIMAALKAGLIVVNTNPLYTPREMKHQFRDSGAKAIIILDNFASKLEEILPDTAIETIILTSLGDMLGGIKGKIIDFVVKKIKKMVPPFSLPKALNFKGCLRSGEKLAYTKPSVAGTDIAFLQYTGGTTGVSKGAILTHNNILANILQIEVWPGSILEKAKETFITALPLYHIYALTFNCFNAINLGAKSILITNPRDTKGFLKTLRKNDFTVFSGVNTLFNAMMAHPDFRKIKFSHLKVVTAGGMALQSAVANKWKELTGIPITEAYGLTETSPLLSSNLFNGKERLGTIGIPVLATDMVILDEEEKEVPLGEAGEICARGPQVFSGYWKQPEATKKAFTKDGKWFKTGDIGIMDEEGYFRIVDRKKDMILVSGFNVYPNEVEDVIASHPKVLECGVVGISDSKSSEAVKAFIVKKDPSLTEEEILLHCKKNLAAYKRPKIVAFEKELPKTNVGKILRRVLKAENSASPSSI